MESYLQTGLGVLVSVILFFVGYRQTIGAKKERAKNANSSIHKVILRRMVLEDYEPRLQDFTKIIEGKSREFRVSINDLLTEEQFLINLYTEVFESELIPSSQRNEIENRIEKCLKTNSTVSEPIAERNYQQLSLENKRRKNYIALLAAATSIVGTVITLVYDFSLYKTINYEWIMSGIGVFIISLFFMYIISKLKRIKEIEIAPTKLEYRMSSSLFETKIAKVINKLGLEYEIKPMISETYKGDYKINIGDKKIIIEAKSWDDNVPLSLYKKTVDVLSSISNNTDIDEILLVVKRKPNISMNRLETNKVKIISINELHGYLKNAA